MNGSSQLLFLKNFRQHQITEVNTTVVYLHKRD